ncbi:MAG: hypothetical protein AAGF06_01455 [Pseudomonadota bacterium]
MMLRMAWVLIAFNVFLLSGCVTMMGNTPRTNADKALAVLDNFNTGETRTLSYVNPKIYVQHNKAMGGNFDGLKKVLSGAKDKGYAQETQRILEDGEFVVMHSKYNIDGPKAGFDVFRFKDGLIVEQWTGLADESKPNRSKRTQFDGETTISDVEKTDANKTIVRNYVNDVLIKEKIDMLAHYINADKLQQHNPLMGDGLDGMGLMLLYLRDNKLVMNYKKLNKVIGEGNFVFTMGEGEFGKNEPSTYYDLYRLEDGKIVEHWDVIQSNSKSDWTTKQ